MKDNDLIWEIINAIALLIPTILILLFFWK